MGQAAHSGQESVDRSSKYYPIRRSTRLSLEIPLLLENLDEETKFLETCSTVSVSAHGCGLIVSRPLPRGTRVGLEVLVNKRTATATIADVIPLEDNESSWLLGLALEEPGNVWGIEFPPADWDLPAPRPASRRNGATVRAVCRLTAISVGACYLQTPTTFPQNATVTLRLSVSGAEHQFRGEVGVEHSRSGMGILFTDGNSDHQGRIEKLIDDLCSSQTLSPEVWVDLESRSNSTLAQSQTGGSPKRSQSHDGLRNLVSAGNTLKREAFMDELDRQRRTRT